MQASSLKYREYYSTLLWLSVSAIAYYLVHLKFLALDFHTRDYAFYTEFIIKWSRPVSEQFYSLNPGGYNFLGVVATDGCDGFYQWIHFEPIRFVQAFIYKLFHSLQAVFIFNCLVVCSPILGITKWLSKTSAKLWENILWVLLFVSFPATLFVAGYDNRPSMFLGVGYFWLLYSLLATKKTWLQFLFFVLLFWVREEALILNAFVLMYLFFQWRKKQISIGTLLIFKITWVIYVIGLLVYFNYWNYVFFEDTGKKYSMGIIVSCSLSILGVVAFILYRKKYEWILFIPFILFVFQLFSMYSIGIFPDEKFSFYNDPRLHLVNLILISIILNWRFSESKIPILLVILATPVCLIVGISVGEPSLKNKVVDWNEKATETKKIFEYKKAIPSQVRVIADYTTHQAFLDHWNLYCLNRLPCHLEKSGNRFYPENKLLLKELFNDHPTLVISNVTNMKITPLLEEWKYFSHPIGKDKYIILPLISSQSWEYTP